MNSPPDVTTSSSKLAILRAARLAFGHHPYDAVTLRDIASAAGVSAPLIIKHFGGKEQLFDTVADFGPAAEKLFDAPLDGLAEHMIRYLMTARRERSIDPLLRVVFAIGTADERTLLVTRFRAQMIGTLTEKLGGAEQLLRADLILASMLGLGAMISIDREGPLVTLPIDEVVALYAPGLQGLIDRR